MVVPKLDQYMIRKFLVVLFFNILAFIAIFVIVDLIENLDKFLSYKAAFKYVFLYYIYYLPYIIVLTLPISMLLSSLFSLGSMAQYNELTAIQTSGISLYRIILPLLILAFVISILSGLSAETVVPMANRTRMDILRYEIKKESKKIRISRHNLAIQDENDRQVNIQFYESYQKKANKVSIIFRDGNTVVKRIDARLMNWDEKRQLWVLKDISERFFSGENERHEHHDSLLYSETRITPEDLLDLEIQPEEMNYAELHRFVDKMLTIGADARKWLVDLYMKISYPFANFIIVVFGAPLAARKRRSGPALGFALALLISFVYFLFLRTGQVLGHKGDLAPWLAAWSGNIVFGIAAIIMLFKAKK